MRDIAILLNPSAGRGRAGRKIRLLENRLRDYGLNYDILESESPEHLERLSAERSRADEIIVGAGGDGTFNVIVNELMRINRDAIFGMINLGTRGDIAREYGTDTIEKACEAIKERVYRRTDVAALKYDGKGPLYFLGTASLGLEDFIDKRISQLLDRHPFMNKYVGLRFIELVLGIAYSKSALKSGEIPVRVKIEHDTGTFDDKIVLAVVNNTRYFDNGKIPSPEASPYDGKIDCCVVGDVPFFVLLNDYRLFSQANHTNRTEISIIQSSKFKIAAPNGIGIQVDGETLGRYKDISLSVRPQALRVLVHPQYVRG